MRVSEIFSTGGGHGGGGHGGGCGCECGGGGYGYRSSSYGGHRGRDRYDDYERGGRRRDRDRGLLDLNLDIL